ncbi:hypothetical protein ACMGDK_11635 [Chryseobacterium sp. DT-3]|uniref:hypothetical protein n=1 Tax=Chryseobacterium sp. DT-3 TaxID=3396164 RepID=UPI003F1CD2BE
MKKSRPNPNEWREVSIKEFYSYLGDSDVITNIRSNFPFTTHYELRNGFTKGISVQEYPEDGRRSPLDRRLFIPRHAVNFN